MKIKSTFSVILLCFCFLASAQKMLKQDLGLNMAGLIIKNQAIVVPSLFYKYALDNKYQLRIQLALDGKLDSKDRKGNFNTSGQFGSFNQDTILRYNPGRNFRYGLMLGIQRNHIIVQSNFSYYYGLDLIFMMDDMYQSAEGVVLISNGGGFDTTKQRVNIKIRNKSKLYSFGLGLPIGLTYTFGKRFYTALEAKFAIVYQKGESNFLTETSQIQNFDEFTSKTEKGEDYKGFDFGLKPLTGLCIGMFF